MLKETVCCAFIVLSLSCPVANGVFNASARTGNSVFPTDTHQSQPATSTTQPPVLAAAGAFFALSVADINASAKWYSEKLGLKVVMQPPKTNQSAVIVLEGGGLIVELIQHDDALPLSKAAPSVKNNFLVHGIFKAGSSSTTSIRRWQCSKSETFQLPLGLFPQEQTRGRTSSYGTTLVTLSSSLENDPARAAGLT